LRGFATINYWTDDLEAATRWYTKLLGIMSNPHDLEILQSSRRT
jgi:hypothetical protein